ncbi:MAG: LysR substrate-binding domain-containing protein [Myxococcales bacterium]
MDLDKLRAFAAVAEEGNITRAARRLRTSQPAVSKQVSELEESLGAVLFDRLPRGVRLTEAGQVLMRHTQQILAAERLAENEIAELSGLTRGKLSIGASTTIGSYLLPGVFGAFQRKHPQVRLELEIANTTVIQAMALDGRIDLGLTEGFMPTDQLTAEVVYYDEMVAIVAPDHPLSAKPKVQLRDLRKVPFISRERGSGTRDVIEAALAEQQVELEPVMSLGSTEAVKRAVAAGLGLAIVSRLTVELEVQAKKLVVLDVADLNVRRGLHLVRLKGKRESRAVAMFLKLLREALV